MSGSIPIIQLKGNLIVSIQVELSDRAAVSLKEAIAHEIRRREVTGLIVEVSGVDVVDSFIARTIRDLAQMARLMGVRTVLAGLDPAMAMTLVEMGLDLPGVETALDLEHAVERLGELADEHARARADLLDSFPGSGDGHGDR